MKRIGKFRKQQSAIVQVVVPVAIKAAISREASAELPRTSASRIASRILCQHYAAKAAKAA